VPLGETPSVPAVPLLDRRATLKDALSILLDADVHAGIVVDRDRRVMGLVTVAGIAGLLRETAGPDRDPAAELQLDGIQAEGAHP
jgi:CBS domain-containing protein